MEPVVEIVGLTIGREHLSDVMTVVAVTGELSVYTAPRLREVLIDVVEHGRVQILVDMSACDFLDSTGLGVLFGGLKRVRPHGGFLGVVGAQQSIQKIFRITGLVKVFPFYDSLAEGEEKLPQLIGSLHTARLRRETRGLQSA